MRLAKRIGVLAGVMAALALAAAILPGCRGKQSTRRVIHIGLIGKAETNDVFQAARQGAADAARELGPKYNVDVVIDWRTPTTEDASKQAEAISALVNQHVDGIAVACSDAPTLTGAINDAVDKGVPVICFDSDAPKSKRLCDYGTDDIVMGGIIMQELAKSMGDKGTVAILAGHQSAPNLALRVQGVLDELKKHPNMHELNEPNGVFYLDEETPEKASEAVDAVMAANQGKIDGWAMVGGWALFAKNSCKWAPGTVKCVSADAMPHELDYLRDGHVQMLIAQPYHEWGVRCVQILLDKVLNGKDPADMNKDGKISNPLIKVTKDGGGDTIAVDEFAKSWNR